MFENKNIKTASLVMLCFLAFFVFMFVIGASEGTTQKTQPESGTKKPFLESLKEFKKDVDTLENDLLIQEKGIEAVYKQTRHSN